MMQKWNDINLSIGLCDITYGDILLPPMADKGTFQAKPTYRKMIGGSLGETQGYILERYDVTFDVPFSYEHIDLLKFYMPTLQVDQNGFYDAPHKVNMDSDKLIIHPHSAGESKECDICIWQAYIDPETSFNKVYGKEANKFNVKFIGKSVKVHATSSLVNSYFYIGDWTKVGVDNAR